MTLFKWLCFLLLWAPASLLAQPVTDVFFLKWQQPIGLTTYRTQIQFDPEKRLLYLGSNGESRSAKEDPLDGLHVLKAKNGKRAYQLQQGAGVDDDVNGVAVAGKRVFFGNDHGQFFCYRKKKQLWSYQVPGGYAEDFGDIEGQPALADLNGDGELDVVFAAEEYGLIALDGTEGSLLWQYAGAEGNGHGLGSPVALDVNEDGTPDLLWGTRTPVIHEGPGFPWGSYGDYLLALDGRDGEEIWRIPVHSALHASPKLYRAEGRPYVIFAETYSRIHVIDPRRGDLILEVEQDLNNGGISAFFSSPTLLADRYLIIGTSWWGADDGVWVMDLNQAEEADEGSLQLPEAVNTFYQAGRVSATAVTGDLLPAEGEEAVIGTEAGELLIFGNQGELLHRLTLPAGLEAPALIADVDGDDKPELLLACLDGQLYCYELP